jgi:hypothetical protein
VQPARKLAGQAGNKGKTMSNMQEATKQSTALAPINQHDDGWGAAAAEAADVVVRGQLLKFADWHWTAGQDATPLKEGTRLLAVGTAAAWVKWVGGKPAEYRVRKPGENLPDRDELA